MLNLASRTRKSAAGRQFFQPSKIGKSAIWFVRKVGYIPPALSLCFIPFLYLLYLIVSYENVLSRIKLFVDDEATIRYIKTNVITSFLFDVFALREWFRVFTDNVPTNEREVQDTLSLAYMRVSRSRHICKRNSCGWEIRSTRKYLMKYGLETQGYRSSQSDPDVWISMSNMMSIGTGIIPLPNNIAYYIDGSELEVESLCLKLNVNIPSDSAMAEKLFDDCAETLIMNVLPKIGCGEILRKIAAKEHFKIRVQSVLVSLEGARFTGTIPDGYDFKLTIECVRDEM